MMTLHDAVADYRKKSGKTVDQIVAELDMSRATYFNKMRGDSELTIGEGRAFAKMLGCSVDEIAEMSVVA